MRHFMKVKQELRPMGSGRNKKETIVVYPEFNINGKDLMRKGGNFYAVLDPTTSMWLTDIQELYRIIDEELYSYVNKHFKKDGFGNYRDESGHDVFIKIIDDSTTRMLIEFNKWFNNLPPNYNYIPLDSDLTFLSDEVTPDMYRSKRLPYDLVDADTPAYEQIISTLYFPEDRQKLEWAIGAVLSGESKKIEKFVVLYGSGGTGKSTILDLIEKIFDGYWDVFVAEELANKSHQFATAAFKNNPLVAIQDDGSLAKIDSPRINEIVSHKVMQINEKNTKQYPLKPQSMLFMATNDTVDIRDTNLGISRRLLDVYPSERLIEVKEYRRLVHQMMNFEIAGIAKHCLDVYKTLGKECYVKYRPKKMIEKTNYLYNFMFENADELMEQDPISRNDLYRKYKTYCETMGFAFTSNAIKFGEQAKTYYIFYEDVKWFNKRTQRNVFSGFKSDMFIKKFEINKNLEEDKGWLIFNSDKSEFDEWCKDKAFPAQYDTKHKEYPIKAWSKIHTTLSDLDSHKLHWINIPESEHHIRIDFDLKDSSGNKNLDMNIKAANEYPPTYAEVSKSGGGVHLHYFYDGDVSELDTQIADGIELKTDKGNQGCRRKLTKCNDLTMATLYPGSLKVKEKKVITDAEIKDEKHLRNKIIYALLKKGDLSSTTLAIHYISDVLDKAYTSGMSYDVSALYDDVLSFANNSSNQSLHCVKEVSKMHFMSKDYEEKISKVKDISDNSDDRPLAFFDVEVFPNVFIICWKYAGDTTVTRMINPRPSDVEWLFKNLRMIGFNNRRYDNHICWAWILGYDNQGLYRLSQSIINVKKGEKCRAFFGNAYNLSYLDVYDLASNPNKMSLKKWEIKLHIHHLENSYSWDQDLPEDKWLEVADYCANDVMATEATYNEIMGDVAARLILAKISGLLPNDTTNSHSMQIIFGDDKNPQSQFIYTDLSVMFPGYKFDNGVSTYRGYVVGEGGFVWAKPGMYRKVKTFDVASMHPSSLIALKLFGELYTQRFKEIKDARLAVKHKDRKALETLLDGKLLEFYDVAEKGEEYTLKDLATALKTVINSVYGLTFAGFPNRCRDPRNVDNIVAKRGALFMVNLLEEVQKRGGKVIHIKTDSIKVVDPTPEIEEFIISYGKQYGYDFEVESVYDRICLVNDAVYIAQEDGEWTATGDEFKVPYVFKTLFSKEDIDIYDLAETINVSKGELYLDYNEGLSEDEHGYQFVGKISSFLPIKPNHGGAELRVKRDDKYSYASGTKGRRWLETEYVKQSNRMDDIDMSFYDEMDDKAIAHINEFGDFTRFVTDPDYDPELERCINVPIDTDDEVPFEEDKAIA